MVRITDGKFKGVVGRVAKYKGQLRVGVVVEGMMTVATAYVPRGFLEKICIINKCFDFIFRAIGEENVGDSGFYNLLAFSLD